MDVSIGNPMKNFDLRFSDFSRLKSGRALTTDEKANFSTYVMI